MHIPALGQRTRADKMGGGSVSTPTPTITSKGVITQSATDPVWRTRTEKGDVYTAMYGAPEPPIEVLCTQDAMVCPDGSVVGRTGPNCEFAPCPPPMLPGSWDEITDGLPPWLPWVVIGGGALWLMTRK